MSRSPLSVAKYYEILRSHLAPMFPGSTLDESPIACDASSPMIAAEGSGKLLVRPDPIWPYYLRLRRSHPFQVEDINIAEQFVRALVEKLVVSDQPFFDHLVAQCPQDVVAWATQHRSMDDTLLPTIIEALQRWASQTYEGARISVAIGVDCSPPPSSISTIHFLDIINREYAKVISNGMDTMLVLSPSGHVVEHLALGSEADRQPSEPSFTPTRYFQMARWAQHTRVALALNRQGEILVFRKQRLQFAFRGGTWAHFSHGAMIARMSSSRQQTRLMRAVYASCLDISFARTGACIAVAKRRHASKVTKYINPDDFLQVPKTEKATLLSHLIGKPFAQIPRQLREEMASLDGAVIVDWKGTVVAAGAIVRVPGGSDGGGRRAAAKALSRLGLAVKVSSDGAITAFTDRGTTQDPEIAFEVCK